MPHRKIPASRGLYWCLEAWRNFKASPQPVLSMSMWLSLGMLLPALNVFTAILITVFYGGVISTLHKKSSGETVWLGDFFNGFKTLPRFLGLFMVGFPTLLFATFTSAVLFNALGPDVAKSLFQPAQPPSEEMISALLPTLFEVMMKLLPVGIVISWIVFLAVPRVMLDKRLGLLALWDAIRAILSNLGAMLLFTAGVMLAAFIASFLLAIPLAFVAGALGGMLQTFAIVFICTLGWALYLNAMYIAWRDIFMGDDLVAPPTNNPPPPEAQIEV